MSVDEYSHNKSNATVAKRHIRPARMFRKHLANVSKAAVGRMDRSKAS